VVNLAVRLDDIEPLEPKKKLCRVVIETPRGSRHKYAFERDINAFQLRKTLPQGMVFPFDFGFIPRTRGGDGDPLDVLVLADVATFAGCVVPCRIIGLIEAEQHEDQKKERNDRFLAVADASEEFRDVRKLGDLPAHILEQTEQFFVSYNKLAGKRFIPLRTLGRAAAWRRLKKSIKSKGG
jgi:inorganic pyrophosphatase